MKEIIDTLLQTEQQAKQIVDSATNEANDISAQTDQAVAARRTEIIDKARNDARQLIEESRQAAVSHKESRLAQLEDETGRLSDARKQAVPSLIKKIVKQVVTVEL